MEAVTVILGILLVFGACYHRDQRDRWRREIAALKKAKRRPKKKPARRTSGQVLPAGKTPQAK